MIVPHTVYDSLVQVRTVYVESRRILHLPDLAPAGCSGGLLLHIGTGIGHKAIAIGHLYFGQGFLIEFFVLSYDLV